MNDPFAQPTTALMIKHEVACSKVEGATMSRDTKAIGKALQAAKDALHERMRAERSL